MNKFSIRSAKHREDEVTFWVRVDGAPDAYRAKLAARMALQNASDTPGAEGGFWDCACSTYEMVYDCIVDYFPNKYRMDRNGFARRIK